MNPAERILRTLDRHLEGPAELRLLGGAALILGYDLNRATEDVDLIHDDREVQAMIASANFGHALEATNAELEPDGLYLTHIWGPEQQILSPDWATRCRPVQRDFGTNLTASVLGPIDLILTKLCRCDDEDLQDIAHIIRVEGIDAPTFRAAVAGAIVPNAFAEVYDDHVARALSCFGGPSES